MGRPKGGRKSHFKSENPLLGPRMTRLTPCRESGTPTLLQPANANGLRYVDRSELRIPVQSPTLGIKFQHETGSHLIDSGKNGCAWES